MSLNKIFDEFNELYGLDRKPLESDIDGMLSIIGSEYDELNEEVCTNLINNEPMILYPDNFVKEGVDIIYATCQQLRERGVNLDAALAEVHRSNMSKGSPDCDGEEYYWAIKERDAAKERYSSACFEYVGPPVEAYVIKCADTGKVIKPTTYSPAVITKDMY